MVGVGRSHSVHKLSVESTGNLHCSCGNFHAPAHLYGPNKAYRLAHGHVFNPYLKIERLRELLDEEKPAS